MEKTKRVKRILAFILAAFLTLAGAFPIFSTEVRHGEVSEDELYAALYDADITSLREAIVCGLLSPTKLTQYYLDRIEQYNEKYNCFITLSAESALEKAAQKDELVKEGKTDGALFGIPVVVKDNIDVEGLPTTNGYSLTSTSTYIAPKNAEIVNKMINEGAIILGKTNMSTGANESRVTVSKAVGETFNAYNPAMASGGSSGGSAVATSLNFAVCGLGTDTNSSLRIPAILNGCVSLRVSRDLISKDGVVILSTVRDTPGVITRSVSDQAIMLDVMTDGKHSFSDGLDKNCLDGMKIGILKELTYATSLTGGRTESKLDPEVQAAFANAVSEFEKLGAQVVTVSFPKIFTLSGAIKNNSETEVARARFTEAFNSLLEENEIEAVIFPTYLNTPLETGLNEDGSSKLDGQNSINNCPYISPPIGCPEISLLIGYHMRNSGIGMEICSKTGNDVLLLSIAYAYETNCGKRESPKNVGESKKYTTPLSELTYRYMNPPETTTEVMTSAEETTKTCETRPAKNDDGIGRVILKIITVILIVTVLLLIALLVIRQYNIVRKRKRRRARQNQRRYDGQ